jgi:hypothetical protein
MIPAHANVSFRKISPTVFVPAAEAESFLGMGLTMDLDSPVLSLELSAAAQAEAEAGSGRVSAPTLDSNPGDALRRCVALSGVLVAICQKIRSSYSLVIFHLLSCSRSSCSSAYADIDRAALAAAIHARLTPYVLCSLSQAVPQPSALRSCCVAYVSVQSSLDLTHVPPVLIRQTGAICG